MIHRYERMVCCCFLFLFIGIGELHAQSQVSLVGTEPIKLGFTRQFNVTGMNTSFPYTLSWTIRQKNSDCTSQWFADGNGNASVYVTFPIPGTFELRCTVNYQSSPGYGNPQQPPAQENPVFTYTVPVYSNLTIKSGLNLDTYYNSPSTLPTATSQNGATGRWKVYKLWAGGLDVGPYIAAYPEYQDTNNSLDGTPQPDTDWLPFSSNDVRFYLTDIEGTAGIASFNIITGIPPYPQIGYAMTFTQTIRMNWTDWCQVKHTQTVGSFNLKLIATTNSSWQVQTQ